LHGHESGTKSSGETALAEPDLWNPVPSIEPALAQPQEGLAIDSRLYLPIPNPVFGSRGTCCPALTRVFTATVSLWLSVSELRTGLVGIPDCGLLPALTRVFTATVSLWLTVSEPRMGPLSVPDCGLRPALTRVFTATACLLIVFFILFLLVDLIGKPFAPHHDGREKYTESIIRL
jgi:hypothetical protein